MTENQKPKPDSTLDTTVRFRIDSETRKAFKEQAEKANVSLSRWIVDKLKQGLLIK